MTSLDSMAAPARSRRGRKAAGSPEPRGWAAARFYAAFIARTFYVVAIRRARPGPVRLP
jgi:hypothetical protein